MQASDTLMYREAHESADVVARQFTANEGVVGALAAELRAQPPRFIVTCARGSSDHAAAYAKYVFETQLGIVTASASPSVTSVYAAPQRWEGALFIAISQSGKSPDLVRNAQAAKTAGARVVAMVNVEDSPLAAIADTVIPLHAGPERSVAATKSYLAALAAILHLCARWHGDAKLLAALEALPGALRKGWDADWSPLVDGLVNAHNLFVVGRGFGFAAALEAALKFKETCGLHAEAYSAAEVLHGPARIVEQGFPVLALATEDASQASVLEVVDRLSGQGARVFVTSTAPTAGTALPFTPTGDPITGALALVVSFYAFVEALSRRRGFDPDRPPHLKKVTETI